MRTVAFFFDTHYHSKTGVLQNMEGLFDFSIDRLGQCKIPSPITLSKVHGDFIANYVQDDEFVRYNVDIYDDVLKKQAEAYNNNLIQKAGPRLSGFFFRRRLRHC